MTLVSVIIPCYNYGHFLPETLDSMLAQKFENWECLIIDDGSTDNTREVAEKYTQNDQRFQYIYQQNSGPSAARNNGIQQSKGAFIQLLDADDLIQVNKLKFQVEILQQQQDLDIVYGDVRFFSSDNPEELHLSFADKNQPYPMPRIQYQDHYRAFQEIYAFPLHPSALLVRKDFLTRHNILFDERYPTSSVEDWHFFILFTIHQAKIFYVASENTHGMVRSHELSTSSAQQNDKKNKVAKYRTMMLDLLAKNILEKKLLRKADKRIIAKLFETKVFKELSEGSIKTAFYFLYLALRFASKKGYFIKNALFYLKRRLIKGKVKF